MLDICTGPTIDIPIDEECNECDVFRQRLAEIEELLTGMEEITMRFEDEDGNEKTVRVLGKVVLT